MSDSNIEYNFLRTELLGISTQKIPICYTISFSPSTVVRYKHKNKKGIVDRWGALRPHQQQEYFHTYINNVIKPKVDEGTFTFELTKAGELHAHGIVFIQDKKERKDFWISDLRKQIIQDPIVQRLSKRRSKIIIHSNYIHSCDNPEEWIDYMFKDKESIPFKPYIIPIIARPLSDSVSG